MSSPLSGQEYEIRYMVQIPAFLRERIPHSFKTLSWRCTQFGSRSIVRAIIRPCSS
ncbi:MAG: hypothetical protein AB1346_06870 [Thermodesulfobacteriota bacterium]